MRDKLKRVLTVVVAFAMVLSSFVGLTPVTVNAASENETETYAIFPLPHE